MTRPDGRVMKCGSTIINESCVIKEQERTDRHMKPSLPLYRGSSVDKKSAEDLLASRYVIRSMRKSETELLKDFLYEAIFIPEGVEAPEKDIVEKPELRVLYR